MSESVDKKTTKKKIGDVEVEKTLSHSKNPFGLVEADVAYGMTMNLGDYESFRADAGAKMRMHRKLREDENEEGIVNAMYDYAWDRVKKELKKQVRSIREKKAQDKTKGKR